MTKRELAISLSKLKVFENPDVNAEQYPTDSEIAGEVLWTAMLQGDIEDKVVADFGAGTGILGIGCLLLGAKKVIFVERDLSVIKTLKENLEKIENDNYEIRNIDINNFSEEVDTIVQNPPFGTKEKHADKAFLEKASKIAKVIYSFHKAETHEFIEKYTKDLGLKSTLYMEYNFPLKKTMEQHKKKVERIRVGCWRFEK